MEALQSILQRKEAIYKLVVVNKKKGESDHKLISRFRQATFDAGVVDEVKERRFHKKKSEERKEKKAKQKFARYLARKRNQQEA